MNGNKLEKQVKDILQKDGWEVLTRADYTDPSTQKPREKDIVATKPQFPNEDIRSYNARLFIECKYFPEATEIDSKDTSIGGIENTLLAFNIPFADISEIEEHRQTHFYEYTEIFDPKDSKDFLYPVINQNLQSFHAFRKSNSERAVYFLIVVYDGELISVDKGENKKNCNNVLIKKDVLDDTYNLPYKKCFIELVSIDQLENLLLKIGKDIEKIDNSASFYYRKEKAELNKKKREIAEDKSDFYGL